MRVKKVIAIFASDDENYRLQLTSPDPRPGASLDNCVPDVFPEDILSADAVRLYGTASSCDHISIAAIQNYRGKPNQSIKIYRSVPKLITDSDKLKKYEKEMYAIMRRGNLPASADRQDLSAGDYYNYIHPIVEELKKKIEQEQVNGSKDARVKINSGDWVTLCRDYAVQEGHGLAKNEGGARILTKTVPARTLYTYGDIHEWGYHP